ncbi:MAG: flagellar basal body rod protein FlgB [Longimicrobiales bacterium]
MGGISLPAALKLGLDASTRAVRGIGHRIANAETPGGPSFEDVLRDGQTGPDGVEVVEAVDQAVEPVDMEREMVALADEQLRFEATTRLLQSAYRQIRSSVREG